MKTGVIVCSNSSIDYLTIEDNMKVMRCILNIEGQEYRDYVDISSDEFYTRIEDNKNLKISTAQTSTGEMIELIEEFKNSGYSDVIVITISSKLSGTFSGVLVAASMVEGINVHAFDSKSLHYNEAYLAITASKMAKENVDVKDIINTLETLRNNSKLYVCVDTLHYLMLNGRLSTVSGVLGNLLNIKPLLHITEEGALTTLEKVRTKSKATNRLIEITAEEIKDKKIVLFGAYTNNEEEVTNAINSLKEITNANIVDTVYLPLTPVVGCHAGPKTFGIGYIIL